MEVKDEVKRYVNASKNYKKQYKEQMDSRRYDVKQQRSSSPQTEANVFDGLDNEDSYDEEEDKELVSEDGVQITFEGKKARKKDEDDLWNCKRLDRKKKKINPDELRNIPLGSVEQERWIQSRKVDAHLDMDFLPRNLVYNYGNFAESNHMMEQVLSQINELNYG